jgi:hypothetical protein
LGTIPITELDPYLYDYLTGSGVLFAQDVHDVRDTHWKPPHPVIVPIRSVVRSQYWECLLHKAVATGDYRLRHDRDAECSTPLLEYGVVDKVPDRYGNNIVHERCNQIPHLSHYCWEPSYWGEKLSQYESFWRSQKETKITENYLATGSTPEYDLVLHFRCGDVPWSGNPDYQLACPESVVPEIHRMVHPKRHAKVLMIVGGHGGNVQKCDRLASAYVRRLKNSSSHAYHIRERASVNDDYSAITLAPKVVTVVASSFVFVARFGRLETLAMPFTMKATTMKPSTIAPWWYETKTCNPKDI